MPKKIIRSCADCAGMGCRYKDEEHYPDFCLTEDVNQELLDEAVQMTKEDDEVNKIAVTSACIEGEYYGKLTRVEETIEFIKRMGYRKIGIASCVGLMRETGVLTKILRKNKIECYTVGCKIGAVDKTEVGVPAEKKLNRGCGHESMCNPVMQAKILEEWGSDFNIMVGLCVGHDTLFLT